MWIYKKTIIRISDIEEDDIITEMNKLGAEGWEIFSITEKVEVRKYCQVTYYTLYMKKIE